MKIVRVHTAALCILGLVSVVPALANQAGTNVVKAGPAASGVTTKARCEVDEVLGTMACD